MNIVKKVAYILVIVGALNWGLVGVFGFDLVAFLFGGAESVMSRIVYVLVGLSALIVLAVRAKGVKSQPSMSSSEMPQGQM